MTDTKPPVSEEEVRSFAKLKSLLLETVNKYEALRRIDSVTRNHFVAGLRLLEAGDESGIDELDEGLNGSYISDRAKLSEMVRDLLDAFNKMHPKRQKVYDIALIVANTYPELQAVLHLKTVNDWEGFSVDPDPQVYHRAEWEAKGKRLAVVAAAQSQVGVVSAAILATKMILRWSPDYLVMTGIAAGYRGNCGDILVPSRVFWYNSGKISRGKIYPDPRWVDIDQRLINVIEDGKHRYVDSIRSSYPGNRPDWALEIHTGALGTGDYVVNDSSLMEEARRVMDSAKDKDRKLIGIDMEAYGIARAAKECGDKTKVLIIKSISDFGLNKSDEHQSYASYTSAQFFYRFATDRLIAEYSI